MIYPLSLHDALPIYLLAVVTRALRAAELMPLEIVPAIAGLEHGLEDEVRGRLVDIEHEDPLQQLLEELLKRILDRKSTRLNYSHVRILYAVFCLKKKKHSPHRTFAAHPIPRHSPAHPDEITLVAVVAPSHVAATLEPDHACRPLIRDILTNSLMV